MSDHFDMGPCCICGKKGPKVRNFVALDFEAPQEKTGWGCLQCDLPPNGAMAVVCDSCFNACNREHGKMAGEIKFVIDGWPAEKKRFPVDQLEKKPFAHDDSKHPELIAHRN